MRHVNPNDLRVVNIEPLYSRQIAPPVIYPDGVTFTWASRSEAPAAPLPDLPVPKIENIHQKVYEAAKQPDALYMGQWHNGPHQHCRAGWVVRLAGTAGLWLEERYGTAVAAEKIYRASDPRFNCWGGLWSQQHDEALADMKRCAEREAARG